MVERLTPTITQPLNEFTLKTTLEVEMFERGGSTRVNIVGPEVSFVDLMLLSLSHTTMSSCFKVVENLNGYTPFQSLYILVMSSCDFVSNLSSSSVSAFPLYWYGDFILLVWLISVIILPIVSPVASFARRGSPYFSLLSSPAYLRQFLE